MTSINTCGASDSLHRSNRFFLPTAAKSKDARVRRRKQEMSVDHIKQYPGPVQVTHSEYVTVPGKHFPQLTTAEQHRFYKGTAVESANWHSEGSL